MLFAKRISPLDGRWVILPRRFTTAYSEKPGSKQSRKDFKIIRFMADKILSEQNGNEQVRNGDNVTVPFLNSCCLVIAWCEHGDIYAQHCQDGEYKNTCNIPTTASIVQAVYITAKKTEDTEAHIRALNEKLNPETAVYYSHKTLYEYVKPVVTIQDEGSYVLDKKEEYESMDL